MNKIGRQGGNPPDDGGESPKPPMQRLDFQPLGKSSLYILQFSAIPTMLKRLKLFGFQPFQGVVGCLNIALDSYFVATVYKFSKAGSES